MTIENQAVPQKVLKANFETGLYRLDDRNNVTIMLFDGPMVQPNQAATIRVLWLPRTARTPLDADATNATIRHIIFAGENHKEVGVYSGAGYLHPHGKIGRGRLTGRVPQASLRLTDSSPGFNDLLGQASLTGRFKATRDDHALQKAEVHLNQLVSSRLGYSQYVLASTPGSASTPGTH